MEALFEEKTTQSESDRLTQAMRPCVEMVLRQLRLCSCEPQRLNALINSNHFSGYVFGCLETALSYRGLKATDAQENFRRMLHGSMLLFSQRPDEAMDFTISMFESGGCPVFRRSVLLGGDDCFAYLENKLKYPVGLVRLFNLPSRELGHG